MSKNECNLVNGLNPLPSTATFLERIIGEASSLRVLSPKEKLSHDSVISCLLPDLQSNPVLKVSTIVSRKVVVVLTSKVSLQPLPPSVNPPVLLVSERSLVLVSVSVPVQTVSQPFHRISVRPVCGSNPPNSLSASLTVCI